MKKSWMNKLIIVLLVLTLVVVGCSSQGAQTSGNPDTIRLAVTDLVGLEELKRDFDDFRKALETALGLDVEFLPVSDRTAAVAALESDQVDMVFTGPAEYIILRSRTDAIPLIGVVRPNYHGLIVVHADSGIEAMEDLKGKKIAMSDVGSTSGHLAPSKILLDGGINPQEDMEVFMLGDNDLTAFKNNDVDAWGGNQTDWDKFIAKEGFKAEDFIVLDQGPQLPNDIFVASNKLSTEFIDQIRENMIEHEQELIEAMLKSDGNSKYEGTELTEAEDSEYDYVRGMYEAIGISDFSDFVGD